MLAFSETTISCKIIEGNDVSLFLYEVFCQITYYDIHLFYYYISLLCKLFDLLGKTFANVLIV